MEFGEPFKQTIEEMLRPMREHCEEALRPMRKEFARIGQQALGRFGSGFDSGSADFFSSPQIGTPGVARLDLEVLSSASPWPDPRWSFLLQVIGVLLTAIALILAFV